MAEQLPLDFSASSAERQRRARRRLEKAEVEAKRPSLFDSPPNIDIHLHSASEAIASITGDPERTMLWFSNFVEHPVPLTRRRLSFDPLRLERLIWVRPPAMVTLDAAATAVARAQWAHQIGLKPLVVSRKGRRLMASSNRWPAGMSLTDVPWTAVAALIRLGLPVDVDDSAKDLFAEKLAAEKLPIATAGLAGSSVTIHATHPDLVEALALPGLAYAGGPDTGNYRLPLLAAEPLLSIDQVRRTPELDAAIRRATRPIKPFKDLENFPWNLYPFQAVDVARTLRVLETTGGVLIAAEMGAGKTTMSLAVAQHLDLFPLLVVSPLSAFSTWGRQLGEMGRSMYLATDPPKKAWEEIHGGGHEVVVISYDRMFAFSELIEQVGFRGVIADEIQRIRTAGSRRSRAMRTLASAIPVRIGLSGTPLTNTVNDVLPLGAFLVPGEWPPRANAKDLADLYPGDATTAVAEHLGSMMVRRRMTEVGAKLPRRNSRRVYVDLTADQRRALTDLAAETERDRSEGTFDGNQGRMHAFARLQKMRQIINAPDAANVAGPNPKIRAAMELAQAFLDAGRKGVIFCADRATFRKIGVALDDAGIGWVGIWGATPPHERIANEKKFHEDPDVKVVLCTIQAGSESWSASPTATWLISTAYMYAPATLDQMEARVYRMNSDPDGPEIEICYVHATAPDGTLDDRMVAILEEKRHLFAQVVDRTIHTDNVNVHYSMSDLVFLLTGTRDEASTAAEADAKATVAREQAKKLHARSTAHAHKGKNRSAVETFRDDGTAALTKDECDASRPPRRGAVQPLIEPGEDDADTAREQRVFDEIESLDDVDLHLDDEEFELPSE